MTFFVTDPNFFGVMCTMVETLIIHLCLSKHFKHFRQTVCLFK